MGCGGTGKLYNESGYLRDVQDCPGCENCWCPNCKGDGEVHEYLCGNRSSTTCTECQGTGRK